MTTRERAEIELPTREDSDDTAPTCTKEEAIEFAESERARAFREAAMLFIDRARTVVRLARDDPHEAAKMDEWPTDIVNRLMDEAKTLLRLARKVKP